MDTKNILPNSEKDEITNEDLVEKLKGFVNKKTGWMTIPVPEEMISESSHLEAVSNKFRIS